MTPRIKGTAGGFGNGLVKWQIAVAYDTAAARDRAMRVSQALEKNFDGDIIFSCTWWRFRYLEDPDIALVARHYAAAADIIIFSTCAPGLFPLPVMNWIESWATTRRKNNGLLVPLIGSPNIPAQVYSTKQFYLRHVADRSNMELLPQSTIDGSFREPPTGPAARGSKSPSPYPSVQTTG